MKLSYQDVIAAVSALDWEIKTERENARSASTSILARRFHLQTALRLRTVRRALMRSASASVFGGVELTPAIRRMEVAA